jgi:peptidyl-prolyl cis-trans isomerase B (cyclophilin B)
MARSSDPDSAGSQFFICLADATFLDGKYTAFGQVVEGDDILGAIGDTPVTAGPGGEKSRPTTRVELRSVEIVNA